MTLEECDYGKKVIREMIKHENDLMNHRLTWLCQIQGFLFTALAVIWQYPASKYVQYVLCLAGVLVAISSFYGLDAAVQAIKKLNDKGEDRKSTRLNSSHIQKSRMPSSA